MTRTFRVRTQVKKPVAEVFKAVVEKELLQKYFCGSASGDLAVGERVVWTWQSHGDFPVQVLEVQDNQKIVFTLNSKDWQKSDDDPYDVTVTMEFEELEDGGTMLSISEAGWPETEDGISGSYDNCEGWTHMGVCLKAFLEYGIDLR